MVPSELTLTVSSLYRTTAGTFFNSYVGVGAPAAWVSHWGAFDCADAVIAALAAIKSARKGNKDILNFILPRWELGPLFICLRGFRWPPRHPPLTIVGEHRLC